MQNEYCIILKQQFKSYSKGQRYLQKTLIYRNDHRTLKGVRLVQKTYSSSTVRYPQISDELACLVCLHYMKETSSIYRIYTHVITRRVLIIFYGGYTSLCSSYTVKPHQDRARLNSLGTGEILFKKQNRPTKNCWRCKVGQAWEAIGAKQDSV